MNRTNPCNFLFLENLFSLFTKKITLSFLRVLNKHQQQQQQNTIKQQPKKKKHNKTNKINTSFAFTGLRNLDELANLFSNFSTLPIFRFNIKTAHASTQKC